MHLPNDGLWIGDGTDSSVEPPTDLYQKNKSNGKMYKIYQVYLVYTICILNKFSGTNTAATEREEYAKGRPR